MACKHASSTSSIQKMADICRAFTILKTMCKRVTSVNLPSGYGLKGQLEYELDRLHASGILHIKLPAKKAILDHIVSCPEIYGKLMQPKTTKKGFVENGMSDEETHTYTDIFLNDEDMYASRFETRVRKLTLR